MVIRSNNFTLKFSSFSNIHCTKCNGSSINIALSNFNMENLTLKYNYAGICGGAFYAAYSFN